MRPLLPILLASLTLGCKAKDPDVELQPFASCEDMDKTLRKIARLQAQYEYALDISFASSEMSLSKGGEDAAMDEAAGGASSYSTTNLQEQDVDEDDLIKTDGTWLYALSGSYLTITAAFPTAEARFSSQVEIDGSPQGIYLVGDNVIVVSSLYGGKSSLAPRSGASADRYSDAWSLITVVDVSDREAPVVVRETYASGAFQQSRRIDDRLFLVTYELVDVTRGADSLSEAKKKIKAADAHRYLPWRMDNLLRDGDWAISKGEACDCTNVYTSETETGTFLTHVLSLDLNDPMSEFEGESVLGRADTVYASTNAIYLAYSELLEGAFPSTDSQLSTVLHKFDISTAAAHPAYKASAKIDGSLSDQFALSEYNDVLRVATTEVENADDDDWSSSAAVWALQEANGQFAELDSIHDLAPNESVFAARFVGRVGYIVTYEQDYGDPLFAIDMTDPTDLRLAGELAVSGFSTYLHPMDVDHLLSVGMDTDDTGEWKLAVSLFDVSDLSAPALTDRVLLDAWSSEAGWEHHAFNYFAEAEMLAIPSDANEGESVLEVLHVDTAGITPIGRVYQDEVIEWLDADSAWCAPIRRSVVMDDDIWAYSAAGLTAAAIAAPEDTLASVPFLHTDPCSDEEYYYEG